MTSPSTAEGLPGRTRPAPPHVARPLLAAKLAPPEVVHATVARRRLLDRLTSEVRHCPVTLLSGPAGSGKTVLADSWRQSRGAGQPVAWLTLDEFDDDPAVFWGYVVAALAGAGVAVSEDPVTATGEQSSGWSVARLAADVVAGDHPVVLVLDNADHLSDRGLLAGLDLLVQLAGSRLRLVLCARADPLLPLHRYRVAGTLGEIRTDELGFTADETLELFAAMGVPVTAEVARDHRPQTTGWAVGLRLAAAPLKHGVPPDRLVTSLARDDGSVAQYLFAEVLADQPAGVRRVLLRTSVTAELWPDLVDRLCGRRNVRRVLAGLAHANAFVEEAPGTPGGFVVHPLFREMLQAQLAFEHPAELAGLHRTCATWYADAGRPLEALSHATAAHDWSFVTRLLIDDLSVARLLAHGTDPLLRSVRNLPAGLRGTEAAVLRLAVALAAGGRADPADLEIARTAGADDERLVLRISAGLVRLVAEEGAGPDPEAALRRVEEVAGLVALLPEGEARARRDCAVLLEALRAAAALRADRPLPELLVRMRAAAAAAQAAGARRLRLRALGSLALLEALEGHLTRAAELAAEAEVEGTADSAAATVPDPAAATALAWVHLRRYSLAEAREWLTRARERARAGGPCAVPVDPLAAVLQSQQLRLRHEYDAAEQALLPHLRGPRLPRWIAEQVVGEVVRLAVARGHVAEGLAILRDSGEDEPWGRRLHATVDLLAGETSTEVRGGPEPSAPLAGAVEWSVVRACQLLEEGRSAAAVEELAAALDRACPELMRWPFVDTPPQARRLLRTSPRLQAAGAWLNPSSGQVPRPRDGGPTVTRRSPAPEGPQVLEALSEREMEVLRHLADMLSTAEIAAAMFISVNTVRTHIRSILRKLAVSRRYQAVRRARERGLL
ncbi:LuxR C-terminal-related transcriptional regulator [Blastococcus sp. SYSU D00922]